MTAGRVGFLHHHADAAAGVDRLRVLAEQRGRAAIGALQPEKQRDGGGFAGAISPEQGEQLAAIHFETEAVECGDLAEAFVRVVQAGERRLRHETSSEASIALLAVRTVSPACQ